MATVRIYKVAELLNTSSQEVIALLKRDHGIEVKSASSTIEEVVARQFVERLARQRNITVPSNASFADTPTPVKGRKPAGKAPEPVKAAPSLPPPRLVKTAKVAAPLPAGETPAAAPPPEAETVFIPAPASPAPFVPEPVPAPAPVAHVEPEPVIVEESPVAVEPAPVEAPPAPAPVVEQPAAASVAPPAPSVIEEPAAPPAPASSERPAQAPAPPAPARPVVPPPGRIVPPTLRLRVEDPRTGQAPPAPPRRPMLVRPPAPPPPGAATGNLSRPAPAAQRPAAQALARDRARRSSSVRLPVCLRGRRLAGRARCRRSPSGRRRRSARAELQAIGRHRRDSPDRARVARAGDAISPRGRRCRRLRLLHRRSLARLRSLKV